MRSLPTANLNFDMYPYGVYRVKREFEVMAGPIAPGFEQQGFGTQFVTHLRPDELVRDEFIERVGKAEVLRLYAGLIEG